MRKVFAVIAALVALATSASAGVEFLWGVTGAAGAPSTFYAINPANGQLFGAVGSSGTVCLSGLAIQPGTGALLATQGQLSPTGASSKRLFRIDRNTGAATGIASLASKYAISDAAMRSDGTLFAFGIGSTVKKLLTVSTSSGAVTEIGNTNNITNVSLTFGNTGTLYLARTNALFTVNTTTGVTALVAAITGATTQIDNFMATRSSGTIYVGLRAGGNTTLYTINPATAVTTLVGTVPGVALSGIAFDTASAPTLTLGKVKKKTKASSVKLKGTVTGIGAKVLVNGKPAVISGGSWRLKVKLKEGKNRLRVAATDVFGQSVQSIVKVTRLVD